MYAESDLNRNTWYTRFFLFATILVLSGCQLGSSSKGFRINNLDTENWTIVNRTYYAKQLGLSETEFAAVGGNSGLNFIIECNGFMGSHSVSLEKQAPKKNEPPLIVDEFEITVLSGSRVVHRTVAEVFAPRFDDGSFKTLAAIQRETEQALRNGSRVWVDASEVGRSEFSLAGSSKALAALDC